MGSAINLSKDIAELSYGCGHRGARHKPPAPFNMLSINYAVSIMIPSGRTNYRPIETDIPRSASSTATIVVAFFSQGVCSAAKVLTCAIAHIRGGHAYTGIEPEATPSVRKRPRTNGGNRAFSGEGGQCRGAQTLTVLSTRIVARMGSAINLSKDIADVSYGYGRQRGGDPFKEDNFKDAVLRSWRKSPRGT